MAQTLTLKERLDRCCSWYAWDDNGTYLGEVCDIAKGFYSGEDDIYDDPDAYTIVLSRNGGYRQVMNPNDSARPFYQQEIDLGNYRIPADQIDRIDDIHDGFYADRGIIKANFDEDEDEYPYEPITIILTPYDDEYRDRAGVKYDPADGTPIPPTARERRYYKEYPEEV